MPDIDVDFCINGRERVIRLRARPSTDADNVAQIITFGSMQAARSSAMSAAPWGCPTVSRPDRQAGTQPHLKNHPQGSLAQEPKLK
jgi:DNA polymerase III subunit alpha